MPGAEEVYNADTEISKWHVRNWSLFLLPLCTRVLDPFDLSQLQPLSPKTFFRFPYSSPFHPYILHDRNLGRKPKSGSLTLVYVSCYCSPASNCSRPLTHHSRMHRFDRLADAPMENGQIHKKYDIIQPDGLAGVGERVDPGDVYINKQTPTNANDNSFTGQASGVSYKNSPMAYKSPIPGNIDKVMITDTDNDQTLIKVLIRQTRRPELGDKFSSRHGQKGVCGLIVNQEDMPFNDQGICPGKQLQFISHVLRSPDVGGRVGLPMR